MKYYSRLFLPVVAAVLVGLPIACGQKVEYPTSGTQVMTKAVPMSSSFNELFLPAPSLFSSAGEDINDNGLVAGGSGVKGAVWTPNGPGGYGNPTTLSSTSSSSIAIAFGLNDGGTAVGSDSFGSTGHATVWTLNGSGSYVETLLPMTGTDAEARGVNAGGIIVGVNGASPVAWTPSGGVYTENFLPTTGSFGEGFRINTAGVIAGGDGNVAVIWVPNGTGGYTKTLLPLSSPGTGSSEARSINDSGLVAGKDGGRLPVAWTPNGSGGYTEVLLPFSGAFPAEAFGVSPDGIICGEDGAHAAVWTLSGSSYVETILPDVKSSNFAIAFSVRTISGEIRATGVDSKSGVVWRNR